MNPGLALLAAAVGYLLGSISFARVVTRLAAPGTDISVIREPVPHSDEVFETNSVSATAVRVHVGTRYGCLTAILDMAKVALPTLAFKLWQPDQPYFLIVAAMGVVGHDWPLYHGFKGGRGESPILGGLIVVDFLGLIVANLLGFAFGVLAGNLLVLRWAGLVLLIPWMWFRFHDWAYVAYMAIVNLVYWYSMLPELRQYAQLKDTASDPTQEELAEFLGMGVGLGRFLDRYSLPALWSRVRGRAGSEF